MLYHALSILSIIFILGWISYTTDGWWMISLGTFWGLSSVRGMAIKQPVKGRRRVLNTAQLSLQKHPTVGQWS